MSQQVRYLDDEKTPLTTILLLDAPTPVAVPISAPRSSTWKRRIVWAVVILGGLHMLTSSKEQGAEFAQQVEMDESSPLKSPATIGNFTLITPFVWSSPSPYTPPAHNSSSNSSGPALVSSLASPLYLSSSAAAHFIKMVGPQSLGEVVLVSAKENATDVEVEIRAIWKQEDKAWGWEELKDNVEGGVYGEDKEGQKGVLGVGVVTFHPHTNGSEANLSRSPARHPHQHDPSSSSSSNTTHRSTLRFSFLVSIPSSFAATSFEIAGGILPVIFDKSLSNGSSFGALEVLVGVGPVVSETLLQTLSTNITTTIGPILGNFSTSSSLFLFSPVGPIQADIHLAPSANITYNLTLLTQVGPITTSLYLPASPFADASIDLTVSAAVGPVNVTLPSTGLDSTFVAESKMGKVEVEVDEREGKEVKYKKVGKGWFGAKVVGNVEWSKREDGGAKGTVDVRSELGRVRVRV